MRVLGQPLQWLIKDYLEEYVLKPFLENSAFSRRSCPVTLFESPDTAKKEEGEFWIGMVNAGLQSPKQACDHLELEFDEDYWKKKQEEEQAQFEKSQKMSLNKPGIAGQKQEKPQGPERKDVVQELRETLQSCSEKDEFIEKCSLVVKDMVKDPERFCGAFYEVDGVWGHGPEPVVIDEEWLVRKLPRKSE